MLVSSIINYIKNLWNFVRLHDGVFYDGVFYDGVYYDGVFWVQSIL